MSIWSILEECLQNHNRTGFASFDNFLYQTWNPFSTWAPMPTWSFNNIDNKERSDQVGAIASWRQKIIDSLFFESFCTKRLRWYKINELNIYLFLHQQRVKGRRRCFMRVWPCGLFTLPNSNSDFDSNSDKVTNFIMIHRCWSYVDLGWRNNNTWIQRPWYKSKGIRMGNIQRFNTQQLFWMEQQICSSRTFQSLFNAVFK